MQLAKKKVHLSAEEVMDKISDYDIYRYYLGEFKVGGTICSPFEKQETGSFGVYMKNGKLYHADFSNTTTHGDAFALVQQLFQLDYPQAIEKIAKDFMIISGTDNHKQITSQYSKPVLEQKRYTFIQCTVKKFTKADIEYWASYGITPEECKKYDIYSIKDWYLNRNKQIVKQGELCFGYLFTGIGWKIYKPFSEDKWKSNIDMTTVENRDAISKADKVMITKSRKCRIVLTKLLPEWVIVNVQNESMLCYNEEFVKLLEGKEVVVNYDNDPPGKKASISVTEKFGYKHINVPDLYLEENVKDFSDMYRVYGAQPILEHFTIKGLYGK